MVGHSMTIHYHGTPITPREVLLGLGGSNFCVSFASPNDVSVCHEIGQSVMLDNGAYSFWTKGKQPSWDKYYKWLDPWLNYATTWAVIPDVIGGGEELNDGLLETWPFGDKGAPVWHLDESLHRLVKLSSEWGRICFGSSGDYGRVGSKEWVSRVSTAFNILATVHDRLPWIHMLRGMAQCKSAFPFASVDSTDVGRNHHRKHNEATKMVKRWDSIQCPGVWKP